ncbi:MAG: type II secretion system protein GspG [Phycisphaerales bacterium]|nr:type II secretion system protein GspG [Phycisphaerales bacterium]
MTRTLAHRSFFRRDARTTITRRGFTLLEMMLVVMIMGLLIGVVAWNIGSRGNEARKATTIASMRQVESMLKAYQLDYGAFPPSLQTLVPKYTEKVPQDSWKRPLIYAPNAVGSAKPYILYSTGESGEQGNQDNIDIWTADQAQN